MISKTKASACMRKLLLSLLLSCWSLPAFAAAPLGDWLCVGNNAGDNRQYKGYVSVISSGETYTVMWRFGKNTYIGTGLEVDDSFAVTFTQPNSQVVGLLLLKKKGETWDGRWTQMGKKSAGNESWRPMSQAQKSQSDLRISN